MKLGILSVQCLLGDFADFFMSENRNSFQVSQPGSLPLSMYEIKKHGGLHNARRNRRNVRTCCAAENLTYMNFYRLPELISVPLFVFQYPEEITEKLSSEQDEKIFYVLQLVSTLLRPEVDRKFSFKLRLAFTS